jgi:phosphopantothenoylcysteine decarboxylase/phosphopantothenate--cysteine ligase
LAIEGKKILIGVTGGVAAYKALEIVRLLTTAGARCQAVLTKSATELIRPESFGEAHRAEGRVGPLGERHDVPSAGRVRSRVEADPHRHGQSADLFLVAPATANILAKMAASIADDLLTTSYLAATCPVVVAAGDEPLHVEPQDRAEGIARLREDGVRVIDRTRDLAVRLSGQRAPREPRRIVAVVRETLAAPGPLRAGGLVTAGHTEAIDGARLTNARAANGGRRRGAAASLGGRGRVRRGRALSVTPPRGARVIRRRPPRDGGRFSAKGLLRRRRDGGGRRHSRPKRSPSRS